ncbi:MAG: MFS transporter [Chloroflexi bacterium]|nr:MFS transporter [Chloroflexota bacterium]MBV9600314.1 MFS transporter [Chloroflexota bacterium]
MASLDATVVNIALPALGEDLHAEFGGLQWVISGYTLTLASLILLGGSLGDRFGRRRVFVIGTLWFALASTLCAIAPTVEILVAARALQGVGGALLTPGSLAMIQASFAEDERGKAIGAWSGFGGIASAIGPFLGGYLVAGPGWRWVFLINLPVAVVVIALAQRHVPESRDSHPPAHLDLVGAGLGALGLAGVTYALIGAGEGWTAMLLAALVLGLLALAAFVVNEHRSPNPMVPPDMFRRRQFTASNVVTFLVYAALGGLFFFLVIDLQVVAGFSPILAGAALLPVTLIMLLLSSRAGALSARIGPRLPMSGGPLVAAVGVLLLLRIGPGASYVTDVLPGVTVFGLGLALIVAPLTTTVLAAAGADHAGVASGINNAVARAAGLLAVAVLPLIAGISGDAYQQPEAFAAGFRIAVITCAVLLSAGGLTAALTIQNPPVVQAEKPSARRHFCAVDGPPLQLTPQDAAQTR